jgi:hypothetical protein
VPSEAARAANLEAKRWYEWLATLVEHWPADTQPRPPKTVVEAKVRVPAALRPLIMHATQPHDLEEGLEKLECRVCHRYSSIAASRLSKQRLASSACLGSARDRAAHVDGQQYGSGHNLYLSGRLVWCRTCGCYGETRLREIRKPCTGPAVGPRKGLLARLLDGRHPASGDRLERAVRIVAA